MARSLFSRKVDEAMNELAKTENKTKVELENSWIWIDGFKATDKDMKCKDFQYELNKQIDMPEDAEIEDCKSGFHLCRDLKDVFGYYSIGDGNRYFKVRALVRAADYAEYGVDNTWNPFMANATYRNKLVAKSIIFQTELTPDEILREFARNSGGRRGRLTEADLDTWSDDLKKVAIDVCINEAMFIMRVGKLVELGYSSPFAHLIAREGGYELAVAVGSQPDMSMDMKALYILEGLRSDRSRRDSMGINAAQMSAYVSSLGKSIKGGYNALDWAKRQG